MRSITEENGKYIVTVDNMEGCKWNYNEVCCNADCPECTYITYEELCKECKFFEQEDGIIKSEEK